MDRFDVVGHGVGGKVGMLVAALHNDDGALRHLIALDPIDQVGFFGPLGWVSRSRAPVASLARIECEVTRRVEAIGGAGRAGRRADSSAAVANTMGLHPVRAGRVKRGGEKAAVEGGGGGGGIVCRGRENRWNSPPRGCVVRRSYPRTALLP